ncbi:VOC family protein [Cryptosporangium phraense]|uniref:VOC family protein n=1 Tax=Cryptosporangium phraense TaxID=2593070 RepID=A0A545AKE7_9ACTN|nr:VOC family protein [Cryptosporangium phraense]TQS41794.1 VOC family protein [Cryptosporangium phraense]
MPIQRLNHAVLYVRDVARSVAFYRAALGFSVIDGGDVFPGAAFLRAGGSSNDHDLGLFQIGDQAGPSGAGRSTVGLYHLAWEVDTLAELQRIEEKLQELNALVGASDHSTTKALYAKDPDGIEFEVSWLVPADLLTDEIKSKRNEIHRLDLAAEVARFGAHTKGGIGVSLPA